MYCGKCGAKVPDGYEFCMKCGTKIDSSAIENTDIEVNKKGKRLLVPIIAILILLCVGIVGFFYINKGAGSDADANGLFCGIDWETDTEEACNRIAKKYPTGNFEPIEKENATKYTVKDFNGKKGVENIIVVYSVSVSDKAVNQINEILTPDEDSKYSEENSLFKEYAKEFEKKYGEYESDSFGATYKWKTKKSEIKLANIDGTTILVSYKPIDE